MMKNKKFLLLLCLPMLAGCIYQQQTALESMNGTCKNLMGCSDEEVIFELGAPQSIQNIGDLTIYKYHQSHGTHRTNYVNQYSGAREEDSWEKHDKIEIFFKNGYAINWKCFVKR